jgi:hypothetical protein
MCWGGILSCNHHPKHDRKKPLKENKIPKFVSIVAITLGSLDLIRGFLHTILLEYAAANIAGLDLSSSVAIDLLRLMGSFGISNFITGVMLILLGWKARPLALTMLGVIPMAYLIGMVGIKFNTTAYAVTQGDWGGIPMMIVYLGVCIVTFIAGIIMAKRKK